jgi:glycosyltransferase involved in cell wall biosynthesis
MSRINAGLASRLELWVDPAGHSGRDVERTLRAALEAGFDPDHVAVIVGDSVGEDFAGVAEAGKAAGVAVLSAHATALNERLDASGAEYLFVVRRGLLLPDAALKAVAFLDRFPEVDLGYGDSMTEDGTPLLRPAASPIRLRSSDYLGPVVVARITSLRGIGGFRAEAGLAQVLDLALRIDEQGGQLALIPLMLAKEDLAKEDFAGTSAAQQLVVEQALARAGVRATIEEVEPFVRRVRYEIHDEPLVSIIIPTRGTSASIAGSSRVLVLEAIRGIVERSTYANLEFVVVVDAETPGEVVDALQDLCGDRLRLVLWDAPFNFSAKMNRGAAAAKGDYLLLLNDDVEVVSEDWIESMLGLAQQREVGIVGALLFFEDSTVQHAGQVYTGGVAGHAAFGWHGGRDDPISSLSTDHEVSGVTAACALISRDLYFEIGGFTLTLPGNYNDVDLNLKVRQTGRAAVLTPWARLYHFESKSRDPKILPSDLENLQQRWKRRMQVELYSRMMM